VTKSESIGKLADALAKAQGEIKGALKDSSNPFFKSTYAGAAVKERPVGYPDDRPSGDRSAR
jgi:hypothetical protein